MLLVYCCCQNHCKNVNLPFPLKERILLYSGRLMAYKGLGLQKTRLRKVKECFECRLCLPSFFKKNRL